VVQRKRLAQRSKQHYSPILIANPASEIEGCRTISGLNVAQEVATFSRFFTNQLWIHAMVGVSVQQIPSA
jgi:energy-converting hydrogenase Eha subunit G